MHTVRLTSPIQRTRAVALIAQAPEGFIVTVRKETRSGEQNAKLWAMLSDVSRAKPGGRHHTPEVWKCLFMHALGHTSRFEMGLNGEPFPVGFRSSQLSKSQMSELLEFIIAWCAQNDVPLSDQSGGDNAHAS